MCVCVCAGRLLAIERVACENETESEWREREKTEKEREREREREGERERERARKIGYCSFHDVSLLFPRSYPE